MRSSGRASGGAPGCGLYVHVPFCRSKCVYCDFYSVTETGLGEAWLEAIRQEAALYAGSFGPFDSLYIGGGTPTVLDDGQLASLFEGLRSAFSFSGGCEVTIEANPDDMTGARARALLDLGVNRLSFGVQSFDDGELAFLKRRHTVRGAESALEAAREAGFSNIGIDLMYGLPGQTRRTWLATLRRALSFGPSHLSCYQLTVGAETPLGRMVRAGGVHLPGEEEVRALFLLTSRTLEAQGFIHYEVSNFAASRAHFCRHNEKYWRHAAYLGLGPSAHSFDGGRRWWNHRSFERYRQAAGRGERPVEGAETLTREQLDLERLYLGLRTRRGIRLPDLSAESMAAVRELRKAGLVRVRGTRLWPSLRGYLVADSLPVLLEPARTGLDR